MRYRIVSDRFAGFEVQIKRWWWPFWVQPYSNTHPTEDKAVEFVKKLNYCREVVINED